MQREKVDFLVAVGEKLCNLEGSTEMQKLEELTDASNNVKSERNHRWDDSPEDFVDAVAEMVSESDIKSLSFFLTISDRGGQRDRFFLPLLVPYQSIQNIGNAFLGVFGIEPISSSSQRGVLV